MTLYKDASLDEKGLIKQRKATWLENIDLCISEHQAIDTARALMTNAILIYPNKQSFWNKAY